MGTIKFVVCDESSELFSEFYETYDEAEYDLENDISHIWSTKAVIIVVNVR